MIFLSIPLCILFSCLGGQINKLFRPIGIPLSIIGVYLLWHAHSWTYCLPVLGYGFIDTLGYGVNSKLMKWLKDDILVRDVFSILQCIPLIFTIALTQNWNACLGIMFILMAYQLRIDPWFKIGKYDVLPDDIARGASVGLAMSLALR